MTRITVLGANGRVGSLVVSELQARGYEVTAFVHVNRGLDGNKSLRIVEGDVRDARMLEHAINGAEGIVSCLGSWGTPTKDILTVGMGAIVPLMEKHGISRMISLTGAEARAAGDPLGLIHRGAHTLASIAAGPILRDGEQHIKLLEESSLAWTVLRSPIMNEKGPHDYRLTDDRPYPWATVNRYAVARALVDQLNDTSHHRQAPFIIR